MSQTRREKGQKAGEPQAQSDDDEQGKRECFGKTDRKKAENWLGKTLTRSTKDTRFQDFLVPDKTQVADEGEGKNEMGGGGKDFKAGVCHESGRASWETKREHSGSQQASGGGTNYGIERA